jgi:regulator of RNase E activity RraA
MQLPGHRINESAPQVGNEVLDAFRNVAVAVISDNLNRLHGTRALRPMHGPGRLVGTAVTVKTRPGDNYALHLSYDMLRPGDVLVVDGGGDLNQALVGEIMLKRAMMPGDIVVGDEDGVIAFLPAVAEELLARIRGQEAREAAALQAIAEGRFDNSYVGIAPRPG